MRERPPCRAIIDDEPVIPLLLSVIGAAQVLLQSRTDTALEIPAPRQQVDRPEEEMAITAFASSRSAFLGSLADDVVSLARCGRNGQTRKGYGPASGWLPILLALEIAPAR